jgi:PAS domain S-box-containing protein
VLAHGPARITLWNAGAAAVYGFEAAEALGRSPHELLATRFPVSLAGTTSALLANGIWSGELRHRARDGAELAVEAVMRMVTLEGGRQVVLVATSRAPAFRAVMPSTILLVDDNVDAAELMGSSCRAPDTTFASRTTRPRRSRWSSSSRRVSRSSTSAFR